MSDLESSASDWKFRKLRELQRLKDGAPIAVADARNFVLTYCDSYTRLSQILELCELMPRRAWYRLLGSEWTGLDNIGQYCQQIKALFPPHGPVAEMMSKSELAIYDLLPELVTIYRGCGEDNIDGLSWTFHPHVAKAFPSMQRYKPLGRAVLVTARTDKGSILAIKGDREEAEVITLCANVVSIQPL